MAATSGIASVTTSSLAFTPFQGIELIDPKKQKEHKREAAADEERYFSEERSRKSDPERCREDIARIRAKAREA